MYAFPDQIGFVDFINLEPVQLPRYGAITRVGKELTDVNSQLTQGPQEMLSQAEEDIPATIPDEPQGPPN